MVKGEKMGKIASESWVIDLAKKRAVDVEFGFEVQIEYSNNCLTGKITKIPEVYKNLRLSKQSKELVKQLKIVQCLKRYIIALPSKHYKISIAKESQAEKTNEEKNKEENIIKIVDNGWFVDLVNKECFDFQYGLKIKIEFFNDCLTAKIIKMSKDFRNERIPKREKDMLKQFKIVQGLDIYSEALRSSIVDNKRKKPTPKPRATPKPLSMLESFSKLPSLPKLPPFPKRLAMLLAKSKLKPALKTTPKQASKTTSKPTSIIRLKKNKTMSAKRTASPKPKTKTTTKKAASTAKTLPKPKATLKSKQRPKK